MTVPYEDAGELPDGGLTAQGLDGWRFDTDASLIHDRCGSTYEVPPCSLTRLLELTAQHVCEVE